MHRLVPLLGLVVSACGWQMTDDDGLVRLTKTVSADGQGLVTVDVPVGDEAALMLWALPDSGQIAVDAFAAPDGSLVVDGPGLRDRPFLLTSAVFDGTSATLVWPVRAVDRALEPGSWEAVLHAGVKGARVELVVHLRDEFGASVVPIQLSVDEALMADPAFVTTLDAALLRFDAIYAEVGLTIDVFIDVVELGSPAPPGRGDDALWAGLASASPGRLVVGVVEQFDVAGLAGSAGGIPGPREPSPLSAVAVAASFAAGPDGSFNEEERRILGETLAHEVMHYLGVFHPVEADWSTYDSLGDTPACVDSDQCTTALGTNLMFPYPVCNSATCLPQGRVTPGQGGVAANWIGVRAP